MKLYYAEKNQVLKNGLEFVNNKVVYWVYFEPQKRGLAESRILTYIDTAQTHHKSLLKWRQKSRENPVLNSVRTLSKHA